MPSSNGYTPLPTTSQPTPYIGKVTPWHRFLESVRSGCLASLVGLHAYGVLEVIKSREDRDRGEGEGIWMSWKGKMVVESVFLGVYVSEGE